MPKHRHSIAYLITVSQAHLLPGLFSVQTLRAVTDAPVVAVGNLTPAQSRLLEAYSCDYVDENDIDCDGRLPKVQWTEKYRGFGWYRSMFIRLCIDRFMTTEQVVILDSEVFAFANWDEDRFYDPATSRPRMFYWIPSKRKSEWDYKMYRGAAYLLGFLPGFENVMEYANSDKFRRHISGLVLFSTKNVRALWDQLERQTDLQKNIDDLFNHQPDLAFSDHDLYGIAVDYGMFNNTVPTVLYQGLLGWYDTHDDPVFNAFKKDAMWSMCQRFYHYKDPAAYKQFMGEMAEELGQQLPATALAASTVTAE